MKIIPINPPKYPPFSSLASRNPIAHARIVREIVDGLDCMYVAVVPMMSRTVSDPFLATFLVVAVDE